MNQSLILIFVSFFITKKCKTPSKPDGIILDQFIIESSETSGDESQSATDVDANVCIILIKYLFFFRSFFFGIIEFKNCNFINFLSRQLNVVAVQMMHQPHRGALNAVNTSVTVVFRLINV